MMLEARDIDKFYFHAKNRLQVLKKVSLNIAQGEIAAVVGPSGAGKSTLMHILGGLDEPTSGEVLLEGEPLQKLSENQLSRMRGRRIGFVFQFYHLLAEFTALENVMLPALVSSGTKSQNPRVRSGELLKLVGLKERSGHFPAQLSGGEQQRVAIARALMNEPRLLLCDEPTGNLDSENGKEICAILSNLNKERGVTIVMVTHNLDVARLASRVYNIKDGVLEVQGQ